MEMLSVTLFRDFKAAILPDPENANRKPPFIL
jgi:hypothetical protein